MYERKRAWRACQACRRKKIKCNGENPCLSCTRIKAECVYIEPHGNTRLVDPQYIVKLEKRITVMEEQLRQQSSAGEHGEYLVSSQHMGASPTEDDSESSDLVGHRLLPPTVHYSSRQKLSKRFSQMLYHRQQIQQQYIILQEQAMVLQKYYSRKL
ncbi:uncharacterized protein N7477_000391 [Penicillium maclennaniae]|uniref:uncharacterized protein n=1 Tax=Penicillium maclennaniae TaxID=1343394 RepID=UPI002540131A|nr:uncharacterized protein N7477_000391 [Penicillium maclennaniae]KAJ5684046.1 hypothetical protein N7477_000391 [Penicillium maclennaniae]